jgi:hypothetical protein
MSGDPYGVAAPGRRGKVFRLLAGILGLLVIVTAFGLHSVGFRSALSFISMLVMGAFFLHFAFTGRTRIWRPKSSEGESI